MNFEKLKSDYERDGYLLISDFVDSNLLQALSDTTTDYLERATQGELNGGQFDTIQKQDGSLALRRIMDPERVSKVYDQAMRYPPLIELLRHLLGGTVRFDHGKLNNKPSHEGGRIQWHQDFAFYPQTNDDMLAIGIMIEDCCLENGAMMVIPGSHKLPIFNHHQNGIFVGGIPTDELNGVTENPVLLEGKAGSITVHHGRTLHASTTNNTSGQRPFLVLNYFAVDAFPIFFNYDWDEFNSRILVGEPTNMPRYETVECKVPFPTKFEDETGEYLTGSIFDLQEDMQSIEVL